MTPFAHSLISLVFILAGFAAVFIMLLLRGNPKKRAINRALFRAHKICGYVFAGLFLLMCVSMIQKTAGWRHEFSARVNLHIALSIALFFLLALKISIARVFKKFSDSFFHQGIILFIMAAVLTGLSAGHYALGRAGAGPAAIEASRPEETRDVSADESERALVETKCASCHTLDRVYGAQKTEEEWIAIVKWMIDIHGDPNFISKDEKTVISRFLAGNPGPKTP
ncbi:membrane hypothetical protein [Candidatus Desulfarcum epimagneticum]|uniref:Cytochrome c domain-containing protein n=1 Tax=uncultured Desulfobacteraceae bacterium TaxID=218296 RepID=A0A484HKB2_9BACT|nr:membrane hypothetical protein [uncultured Desulfobacteraceae bacterium]